MKILNPVPSPFPSKPPIEFQSQIPSPIPLKSQILFSSLSITQRLQEIKQERLDETIHEGLEEKLEIREILEIKNKCDCCDLEVEIKKGEDRIEKWNGCEVEVDMMDEMRIHVKENDLRGEECEKARPGQGACI